MHGVKYLTLSTSYLWLRYLSSWQLLNFYETNQHFLYHYATVAVTLPVELLTPVLCVLQTQEKVKNVLWIIYVCHVFQSQELLLYFGKVLNGQVLTCDRMNLGVTDQVGQGCESCCS